jgi:phage terminase large subunit-like protein
MNQPRICLAREYAPDTLLIEQTGPGLHLVQELRANPETHVPVPIGIKPEGDKHVRMEAQSPLSVPKT